MTFEDRMNLVKILSLASWVALPYFAYRYGRRVEREQGVHATSDISFGGHVGNARRY